MFGDFDLNSLMQQAQKMQDDLERAQAELADKEYTASAGGDLVSVKLSGKGDLLSVDIKPEAWDPEDPGDPLRADRRRVPCREVRGRRRHGRRAAGDAPASGNVRLNHPCTKGRSRT